MLFNNSGICKMSVTSTYIFKSILSLLFMMISLSITFPVYAERVDSAQQKEEQSAKNMFVPAFLGTGIQPYLISLPQIQVDLTQPASGVFKTGVVYPLPAKITAAQLYWESVSGGYVSRIHLVSNQAKRLRYHLSFSDDIPSIKFRVQGSMDASPLTLVDHTSIYNQTIWLPITTGNEADLEIFVDDTKLPESWNFTVDLINVIVVDANNGGATNIKSKSLGLATEKEYDLACWASSQDYSALQQAAAATAKINFTDSTGSYICTGTLLNDKGSTNTPWFATASHCINDQSTASSLTFEWFYQATSCGGAITDSRYTQTSGGAQLLWKSVELDASFLKLNTSPPNGTVFSGWDTTINVNDLVWGVHHPHGDHTMVSEGNVTTLRAPVNESGGVSLVLNEIQFVYGGAEPGSSGSGLFAISNGYPYWKGTLYGGPDNDYQLNWYSDFGSYYANIQSWLAPIPTCTAHQVLQNNVCVTATSIFLNPNESFTVPSNGTKIYGYSNNTVTIASGVTGISIDQNVKTVNFSTVSKNYPFIQTGNVINVYDISGTALIARITIREDGTTLNFSDGTQSVTLVAGLLTFTSVASSKLNDTGITTCSDASQNGLSCPVAGFPNQDAQVGRDKTANNDSDGHAGFSFTKISSTGAALSASASSWNCVKDNVTGLTWEVKTVDYGLRDKDNTYSWYQPDNSNNGGSAGTQNGGSCTGSACDTYHYVQAVNAQGLCGTQDWRMPDVNELLSIVDNSLSYPSIDTAYFPNTNTSFVWSSSPGAGYSNSRGA